MTLRVVEKLAYHCSLKGAAELMRRDRLPPTCAARRLPTTTPACTAVPLRESKRATSSPFVTVTYLAIGAAPFSYVGLACCAKRVAPNRRVGTRRHHCKRRHLYKVNETWDEASGNTSGGVGRSSGADDDPRQDGATLAWKLSQRLTCRTLKGKAWFYLCISLLNTRDCHRHVPSPGTTSGHTALAAAKLARATTDEFRPPGARCLLWRTLVCYREFSIPSWHP